ncbi:MAG: preprotein translocase subunit SecG [Candidatus Yanofskybacteria bacterium]|nr:preprotein translocase subunit SecG [Candidatus Yanofskybacteria bacterium]
MDILPIVQIAVSLLLIASILLQQRGTALGSAFGGGTGTYTSRRGAERKLYLATIVLAGLFVALAVLRLTLA